jgi:predicted phosphodiesterase
MLKKRTGARNRYNTLVQFLVLADLHANWHALEAVLRDADGKFDQIICCGDLVGYNPHPVRVLDWTRQHCGAVIRGNHDKVVAGIEDIQWFNEVAQSAAIWTIRQLNKDQIEYLGKLQKGPIKLEHFHICHGSPRDEDEYITTAGEASPCFSHLELPLTFFAHTHLQGGFSLRYGRVNPILGVRKTAKEASIELESDAMYMVNPGSVGQPRDGDARAAYAMYDSEQKLVMLRRVEYPIQKTAEDIMQAGLPDVLAFRLFQGL